MRIVLCCAGGFSTTMLMENMKKTIKKSKKLDIKDFDFKAIPVDLLEQEAENTDVLLIGPQISHKVDMIKRILDPLDTPYVVIDQDTYGSMDGGTALKLALIAYRKKN